jgi:hypothetical protein
VTHKEQEPNNAASRARRLFALVVGASDKPALDVWAQAFGIEGDSPRGTRVARQLLVLADELKSIEDFANAAGLRERQWKTQLVVAFNALAIGNLAAGWNGYRGELLTHSVLLTLDWLSDSMPDEGALDVAVEEARDLRRDLIALRGQVALGNLPTPTREVLYRAIEEMLRALDDAPIGGVRAIRRHALELYATLEAENDVLVAESSSPEIGSFASLVARFKAWAPNLDRVLRIVSATVKVIEAGDKIHRLMSGQPPADPPTE